MYPDTIESERFLPYTTTSNGSTMTVSLMKLYGAGQIKKILLITVVLCYHVVNSFHTSCPIQTSLSKNIQNPASSPQYHGEHRTKLRFTQKNNIEPISSNIKSSNAVNNENTTSLLDPVLQSSISSEQDDMTQYLQKDETSAIRTITKEAWILLLLTFSVAILSALDRVAMSVAILPISSEYSLTESSKGLVSSVFSAGYGLAIIPAGLFVATNSPKVAIGGGVFLWSLGTVLTPISLLYTSPTSISAQTNGLELMLFVRSIVGAAESIVLPAVQKILYLYVPKENKSLATAGIYSGFQLGTILAYLVSPLVIDMFDGWRGMFYVYGALGFLWLVPWITLVDTEGGDVKNSIQGSDSSNTAPLMKSAEDDAITVETEKKLSPPWNTVLTSPSIWAITAAHAANNWGLYNSLSWAPTFYAEQYNLNVKDSAFLSVLPSVAGAASGLLAGYLADTIIKQRNVNQGITDNTNIRKLFQGMALLGPCLCYFTLSQNIPSSPAQAQLLLTTSTALQAFNAGGYGPACQEKAGKKWGGFLYSITSLPGVMFGTLGVYITGRILDANGKQWDDVFALNSLVFAFGALWFIFFYNGKRELD